MSHRTTHLDYEGFGVFEFSGLGADALPSIPGFPSGVSPASMIVVDQGLQVVKPEYRASTVLGLDQLTFSPQPKGMVLTAPVVSGQAAAVFGVLGSGWASSYLAKGYAIMVEKAAVQSAAPKVIMANVPEALADEAGLGGAYAIVDGPVALIAAAKALLGSDPALSCPAGTIFDVAAQKCLAIPGGDDPQPGSDKPAVTQPSAMSAYALPLGIVAVGVVAAYFILNKKPSYTANARRRRRRRARK